MDPMWSETCWSIFNVCLLDFRITSILTSAIFVTECISWLIKVTERCTKLKLGVEMNSSWCTRCCHTGKGDTAPLVLNVCTISWWKIICTAGERLPVTCWVGDCVGPRDNLGALEKRQIARPCRESKGYFLEVYKNLKYASVVKC